MWAVPCPLIEALVYLYYEEMRVRPEETGLARP